MPGGPVTRETTLAILLGGSAWPKSPQLAASPAFAASAEDFRHYLSDPRGFGLPASNILNLFDSPKTSPEIVEDVQNYLRQKLQTHPPPSDLFVYYTGHGGFTPGRDYFLAVRSTIEGLEGTSSIRVADLASALRTAAKDLRRFLILDCCFAAAAFKEFQSTPGSAARLQTLDAFPRRGTTLLCSSSSRNVSIAPEGERHTMFSGALLDVLRTGDAAIEGALSLEDVGLRISELVRERYEDRAIRPEVHSPDQRDEDIARMPLFPNVASSAGTRPPRPPYQPSGPSRRDVAFPEPEPSRHRRYLPIGVGALMVAGILIFMSVIFNRTKETPAGPATAAPAQVIVPEPARQPEAPPPSTAPANIPKPAPGLGRGAGPVNPAGQKAVSVASDTSNRPGAPTDAAPKAAGTSSLDVSGVPLQFVNIRSGQFRMGCASGDTDCEDDEKPVRRVSVDAFDMSATEVTQELWQAVMDTNPSDFKGTGRPVEHISWNDAQDFLERLNQRQDGFRYRLPTESEWEYAARAGDATEAPLTAIAWFGLADGTGRTSRPQPVGAKKPNAWGLQDMLGNVAEWCEDWYSPNYQRVVRGGSWMDAAKSLRLSARGKAMPGTRDYSIGLRLVREPKR